MFQFFHGRHRQGPLIAEAQPDAGDLEAGRTAQPSPQNAEGEEGGQVPGGVGADGPDGKGGQGRREGTGIGVGGFPQEGAAHGEPLGVHPDAETVQTGGHRPVRQIQSGPQTVQGQGQQTGGQPHIETEGQHRRFIPQQQIPQQQGSQRLVQGIAETGPAVAAGPGPGAFGLHQGQRQRLFVPRQHQTAVQGQTGLHGQVGTVQGEVVQGDGGSCRADGVQRRSRWVRQTGPHKGQVRQTDGVRRFQQQHRGPPVRIRDGGAAEGRPAQTGVQGTGEHAAGHVIVQMDALQRQVPLVQHRRPLQAQGVQQMGEGKGFVGQPVQGNGVGVPIQCIAQLEQGVEQLRRAGEFQCMVPAAAGFCNGYGTVRLQPGEAQPAAGSRTEGDARRQLVPFLGGNAVEIQAVEDEVRHGQVHTGYLFQYGFQGNAVLRQGEPRQFQLVPPLQRQIEGHPGKLQNAGKQESGAAAIILIGKPQFLHLQPVEERPAGRQGHVQPKGRGTAAHLQQKTAEGQAPGIVSGGQKVLHPQRLAGEACQ